MAFPPLILDTQRGGETDESNLSPNFSSAVMRAADSHNLLSNGRSWYDGILETAENIPKFVAVSIASGVNQVYNIAPTVGNWFGGDFEQSDLKSTLQDYDDDLSKYYQEHQQAADVVGFILSSFVPGTAGIKLLHGGQALLEGAIKSGSLGGNLGKAAGLLAPSQPKNLAAAINSIRTTGQTFTFLETNTLKALGAGAGQAALEGFAFETAVAATMYNSPILKDHDFGDIVSNIMTGTVLFGVIGGAITGAKTFSAIKTARTKVAAEEAPWIHITEAVEGTSASHRIATWLDDLKQMPVIEQGVDTTTKRTALAAKKTERVHGLIQEEFYKLAGKDSETSVLLSNSLRNLSPDVAISNVWQMTGATRLSQRLPDEFALKELEKKVRSLTATTEELKQFAEKSIKYVGTRGENAGTITDKAPAVTYLADSIPKNGEIIVTGNKVTAGELRFEFSPKKDFDVSKASSHLEVEARQILAQKSPPLPAGAVVFENDIPFLTKAYLEGTANLSVKLADGSGTVSFASRKDFLYFIEGKKQSTATKMLYEDVASTQVVTDARKVASDAAIKESLAAGVEPKLANLAGARAAGAISKHASRTQEEIAKLIDVKSSYLSGVERGELEDMLFASRAHQKAYNEDLVSKGIRNPAAPEVDAFQYPSTLKISYDTKLARDVDGIQLEAMVAIKQDQVIRQGAINRAVADALGDDMYGRLPEITDKMVMSTNPVGAGSKFFSFASANYGTPAALMEYVGNAVTGAIRAAKSAATDTLTPSLMKIRQNQKAAIELENIIATTRGTSEKYVLNEAGNALVLRSVKQYDDAVAAGEKGIKTPTLLDTKAPREIPISSPEVAEFLKQHIKLNGARVSKITNIRSAENGMQNSRDPLTFYPPARNPKDYPHFAFVVDESITGTGHSKMLYAASEKELTAQMNAVKAQFPEFKVLTKGDAENYYKSIGKFEYERTLSENYIDTALGRKGISTPFLIRTDPAVITDDLLKWHLDGEASTIREAVSAKYGRQFEEFRRMGDQFTLAATSKFGGKSLVKYAESTVANPYTDYIKTALGINASHDYPYWMPIQKLLDTKVSQLFSAVDSIRVRAKSVEDLKGVNELLQESGYRGAYYDAALESMANHVAPRGVLTSYVQHSNALLSTFALRLDPINSLVNVISSNVLRVTEIKSVLRAINSGNSAAVGQLAELTRLKVPGTGKDMFSAGRLMQNAIKNFHVQDDALKTFYKDNGFITNLRGQYLDTLDSLALRGTETEAILGGKLKAAYNLAETITEKGTKLTGNNLAEEFNRFVSADVMRQITDIAVSHNLMTSKEALTYINTFVNRVEGNFLAAQRPMMFQGPVGQAIGLFQTYQFNLIQQLLRHVGEGSAKDAAILLGMQGTIYGLNGLPAFNAINTHIIGTASGNSNYTDAYTVAYGAAGKEAGDWLMYGLASNMLLHPDLKLNLYTRGDINPRHLTVVPTNPADVPIIAATAKVFGNLFNTAAKLGAGGDVVGTLLQGLEHNGVSRPLAGLAQTLETVNNPYARAFSTSSKGNVIASNDIASLATLGRLAGAKPLDEAVVQDATFRIKAYAAKESDRMKSLGAAIRTTVIAGNEPSQEQIETFASAYVSKGGRQENFNKFMLQQYKSANTSQANALREQLGKPYTQSLQSIMGAYELKDFSE